MIDTIIILIFFVIVIIACCSGSSDTSKNNTNHNRNRPVRRNTNYDRHSYCECPSCGASGYDGYCEECGYPDINQGWLGEEYG